MTARLVDFEGEWFHWNDKPYHIGIWTNWSKESPWGSTLTLPSNEAKVLLAGIALFVAAVGAHAWSIAVDC
jgi:hypothetical protein